MPIDASPSRGFTLAETLVAIVLIALVLGVLEGNSTGTLRRVRDTNSESIAARLVQSRAESILAGPCTPSSGTDSIDPVAATWQATTDGVAVQITQTVHYQTAAGLHTESFQTAGACP